MQQEGGVGTVGCVLGVLAGAAMLSVMIQRVQVRLAWSSWRRAARVALSGGGGARGA